MKKETLNEHLRFTVITVTFEEVTEQQDDLGNDVVYQQEVLPRKN